MAIPDIVIKLVIVGALLFFAYYLQTYVFISESFKDRSLEVPAMAPQEYRPPIRKPIEVTSGGPGAPNAQPPKMMMPTLPPGPAPSDPLDDQVQAADAPQDLRYPERSFGPGKVPNSVAIAQASGIAAQASMLTAQSSQQFSPELVANGGMFFGDVAPIESENPNYTAF